MGFGGFHPTNALAVEIFDGDLLKASTSRDTHFPFRIRRLRPHAGDPSQMDFSEAPTRSTMFIMSQPKLARAGDSTLVVIDIQERLAAVMPARASVVRATGILLEVAARLNIPVLVTEQYPKGLGSTVAEVAAKLPEGSMRVEKTCFSACATLPLTRPQVVLTGMEAHVCVLQTALELAAAGREVFVVGDAVSSRTEANYSNALARLQTAGIVVTNTESLVFEWLRDAAHEHFQAVLKLIR